MNLAFFKEHPYETGGIVLGGAVLLFYLLSSGGSSSTASAGADNTSAYLGADVQLAQISAAANVQSQQGQVQQTIAEYSKEVTDNQTAASLAATLANINAGVATATVQTYADVTNTANTLASQQNIYGMQESVLKEQIDAATVQHANDNATYLAGTEYTVGAQKDVALSSLDYAHDLATKSADTYASVLPYILSHAGEQKNSGLDAANQTSLFQTILSGGNPGVAASGNGVTSAAVVSGNSSTANIVASLTNGVAALTKGLFS